MIAFLPVFNVQFSGLPLKNRLGISILSLGGPWTSGEHTPQHGQRRRSGAPAPGAVVPQARGVRGARQRRCAAAVVGAPEPPDPRRAAQGDRLIRRTLGSLSNSSTPVGSTESLPDAVFASTNHHAYQQQHSWGSSPPSRPGTPTLAELLAAVSSMPPSPTPHVGFLPRRFQEVVPVR
ncbi:hypothetical protein HPB48_001885 [Haemaphysalis longicornis]|uniref:Uncharacterized protein n=1 Tax=Haemaphysalis longicornis TaxID=44386 RepID=A0A9J6G661_HAELO|nr:hypothetical protein HPB48_001885 [Haemaphysalis longicornis]